MILKFTGRVEKILTGSISGSPKFARKTASISFKSNEKLGQVRLRLYQTSKKAPPPRLRNPGYAPARNEGKINRGI